MPASPVPAASRPSASRSAVWLSHEEEQAWIAAAAMIVLVPGALDAQLQRDAGLNLFEYLVLSRLSMAPGRALRMSELAELANGSPSRLSNVARKLEARGWIRRYPDAEDGRCMWAAITESGYALVVAAAPGHVAAVRKYVIDPLSQAQVRSLAGIGRRIRQRITGRDGRSPQCA